MCNSNRVQNIRGWVVTAREEEELDLLELVLDSQLADHVDVELLSGFDPGARGGSSRETPPLADVDSTRLPSRAADSQSTPLRAGACAVVLSAPRATSRSSEDHRFELQATLDHAGVGQLNTAEPCLAEREKRRATNQEH